MSRTVDHSKRLASLIRGLSPKTDLAKFRNDYRDAMARLQPEVQNVLSQARDAVEHWSASATVDGKAALQQWQSLYERAKGMLPTSLQIQLLRKLPPTSDDADYWRQFISTCRSRELLEAVLASKHVTRKQLRAWIIQEPSAFRQSAGLDLAILLGLPKGIAAVWREVTGLGERPAGLLKAEEALVLFYSQWTDGKADPAFCVHVSHAPAAQQELIFTVLLDYVRPAARFAQEMARQLAAARDGAIGAMFQRFARFCVETARASRDPRRTSAATALLGLCRLCGALWDLPGQGSAQPASEPAARTASEEISLAVSRSLDEDPAAACGAALLVLRGSELQEVMRKHLNNLRPAATDVGPLDRSAQYHRYSGQRELLQSLISLLEQPIEGDAIREELEVMLFNAGLRSLGEVEEQMEYDARFHRCDTAGLLPGDRIAIIRPGRQLETTDEPLVLSKALVRFVED